MTQALLRSQAAMIYLDHAATTPLHPAARAAMLPFLNGSFGNPGGLYASGREAQAAVDEARRRVAACLGASAPEV
jgi:cysteine desulfurase